MAEHAALGPIELYVELIGPRPETGIMAPRISLAFEATDPILREMQRDLQPGGIFSSNVAWVPQRTLQF